MCPLSRNFFVDRASRPARPRRSFQKRSKGRGSKNQERCSKCGFQRLLVILIGWKSHLGRLSSLCMGTWHKLNIVFFWSFRAILGDFGHFGANPLKYHGHPGISFGVCALKENSRPPLVGVTRGHLMGVFVSTRHIDGTYTH